MTLKLPTSIIPASSNITNSSILIFGPDKCGKSSFAAQFPNHFMLEFNPGNANHINRKSVDVHNWEEAIGYLRLIVENPSYCEVIIIDELQRMYGYCYRYVRQKLKLAETEKDDFDVWRTVRNLFSETLDHIKQLNKMIIITANEDVVTASIGGRDVNMLDINLNNQGRDVMHGYCLMRARMECNPNGGRILHVDGLSNVNIGHGFSDHFLWEGNRLKEIDLGFSPEEAYSNFIKAYDNQLPGKTIVRTPVVAKKPTLKI
ncbi:MAG: AAA family ATPase [Sphingobacteriaceae bacterium]|nr:AAA family ATPase [Sphingobacteriaceae bacterium]